MATIPTTKEETRQFMERLAALVTEVGGMLPPGDGPIAIVDRARFERLLTVAEAAHEWVNAPVEWQVGQGPPEQPRVCEGDQALISAVDALHPGDLDPLT